MTHRFRNVIAVAAAAAWLSAPAGAQQPQQGPEHDHDAHHRDMLTRGAQAMGFDQERTVHHFLLYEDGGAIDVTVKETSDPPTFARFDSTSSRLPDCSRLETSASRRSRTAAGARYRRHGAAQGPHHLSVRRNGCRWTGTDRHRAMPKRSRPSTHSCTSRSRITAPAIRVWLSDRRRDG